MIKNLANYNAWKRSTLDRVSGKYKRLFMIVINNHLREIQSSIISHLDSGQTSIDVNANKITQDMIDIFEKHLKDTTYVAVSDGLREMSPSTKLSTWEQWPYWYPVEQTFVELSEKKLRDDIFKGISKKMSKKLRSYIGQVVNLETERYVRNVKAVFNNIAKIYFADPENQEKEDVVKDVIKRVFKKTETQAETIFRTETTRFFNEARVSYFQENTEVDFVQLVAVTDGRISNICESRDGYVVPIGQAGTKKYKPPFHPNCRTIQSPLDTDLSSDAEEVRKNLGSEFGKITSGTSKKEFTGRRTPPDVALPNGWG